MAGLDHPHPVPIRCFGLHLLERAVVGIVVHDDDLARYPVHGALRGGGGFEGHLGRAPVEHDGEDAGGGHSAASRWSGGASCVPSAVSITRRIRAARTRTLGSSTMESWVPGTSVTFRFGACPDQSLSGST